MLRVWDEGQTKFLVRQEAKSFETTLCSNCADLKCGVDQEYYFGLKGQWNGLSLLYNVWFKCCWTTLQYPAKVDMGGSAISFPQKDEIIISVIITTHHVCTLLWQYCRQSKANNSLKEAWSLQKTSTAKRQDAKRKKGKQILLFCVDRWATGGKTVFSLEIEPLSY